MFFFMHTETTELDTYGPTPSLHDSLPSSSRPPSPDGATGMTTLTCGSALVDTVLTAPVVRSATSADWRSGSMMRPLVLSRQPCITPGAGHSLEIGRAHV